MQKINERYVFNKFWFIVFESSICFSHKFLVIIKFLIVMNK